MMSLEISENQKKEIALTENGQTLFQQLNNARFEWKPKNSKDTWLRFTSREQATNYAYYQLQKKHKAERDIEYMIEYDKKDSL